MLTKFMHCYLLRAFGRHGLNRSIGMSCVWLIFLAGMTGCVHEHTSASATGTTPAQTVVSPPPPAPPAPAISQPSAAVVASSHPERVHADCIEGRRVICGKVLKFSPDGLVVDSGYTDLLRPPLTESWVIPGTVSVSRNPAVIELKEPGSPCIGLVFLTDTPKRRKPKVSDYVAIIAYPAGEYVYSPMPPVEKTIRKFSCGLDTAVRLRLQAETNNAGSGSK
jgi:hypothetical protein